MDRLALCHGLPPERWHALARILLVLAHASPHARTHARTPPMQEEHQLPRNAQIRDSGDGFIQVPLPEKKQLIGIKFKQKEDGPVYLQKIRAEMGR